jgi:nicotinamide-nucleotide amidase
MPTKKVLDCAKAITERGLNLFFVESATAGRMCSEFALSPQSGKFLRGGINCYEVFIKEQLLKVPHKLIEKHTPESAEVTESLAKNSVLISNAKITVAVTGLTTPGGSETEEKPVGTMFLHIILPGKSISDRQVYKGSPEEIMMQSIDRAAEIILDELK